MRPWMIILASTVAAIAVAAALAGPEVLSAPRADLISALVPHLPSLAVAALGVYALGAMVLTTATLVLGTLSIRQRLGRAGTYRALPEGDWIAAFGATELRRLAPRLAPTPARTTARTVVLQNCFRPAAARGELTRLHYIGLARSHFFSALITLAALVGLGLAQDHGTVPLPASTIPTTAALLMLIGLGLLALLGRIAIDVTADPLIDALSQLPFEQAEAGVLRRAIEALEAARGSGTPTDDRGSVPMFHVTERLALVVEEGHRTLIEAIGRLSANADALEHRMQGSIEAIETATKTIAASMQTAAGPAELRGAVEALTAVLERLANLPDAAEAVPPGIDQAPPVIPAEPRLARELRRLLREIEPAS